MNVGYTSLATRLPNVDEKCHHFMYFYFFLKEGVALVGIKCELCTVKKK